MSSRAVEEFSEAHDDIRLKVTKLLRTRGNSWGEATTENMASEVMSRVWENWDAICGEPLPWAITVTKNLIIDEYRRRPREAQPYGLFLDDDAVARLVAPTPDTDTIETLLDIHRALRTMPPEWQDAVVYMRYLDMTADQAAAVMKCQPATVQKYVSKARDALGRKIQRNRPDPSRDRLAARRHRDQGGEESS